MKPASHQAQLIDSSAVGRDGYVRVRPTWGAGQIHQMDAGGFGRYIGWLLGAMFTALLLVLVNDDLAFWMLLVGIAVGSIIGALVGHVLARFVWGRLKRSIDAVNPRQVLGRDVEVGSWMMTRNDGTDRVIRIQSEPQEAPDPEAAIHERPVPHVRFLTSTGRYVTVPAEQSITIVDLAVDIPTSSTDAVGSRATSGEDRLEG